MALSIVTKPIQRRFVIPCPKGCGYQAVTNCEGKSVRKVCKHIVGAHGFQVVSGRKS
jgi:hypothetical protein